MANPLETIFSLFKKNGESVIGIDVGSSAIKIVQLRKKAGRAILETYGELALGPYAGMEIGRSVKMTSEKVSEGLIDLMKESKVTTNKCGIAIPISSSLVTMIEMPLVDEKQLAQMIPIEARKYIPVPISEVMLDWWVIPKTEDKSSPMDEDSEVKRGRMADILLVVIHNEAITRYQEIIKNAFLESSFFEIEIFSTMRAVLDQEVTPVALVDMGAASTKLYIVEQGIVKSSHVINRGSQDITLAISRSFNVSVKDAEIMKRNYGREEDENTKGMADLIALTANFIFSEINRVLLGYQKKQNKNIGKVVLTGGGVTLHSFLDLAKASLQTEVVLGDPFSKIEAPAFLDKILKQAGPEFAVALGVALRKLQEMK